MRNLIECPYTYSEIQEMFEKQRDKVPFETIKEVKDESGTKWKLTVKGRFIGNNYFDIWNDDYIISFCRETKDYGGSSPHNRFSDIDAFKKELYSCLHLEKPQQIQVDKKDGVYSYSYSYQLIGKS